MNLCNNRMTILDRKNEVRHKFEQGKQILDMTNPGIMFDAVNNSLDRNSFNSHKENQKRGVKAPKPSRFNRRVGYSNAIIPKKIEKKKVRKNVDEAKSNMSNISMLNENN